MTRTLLALAGVGLAVPALFAQPLQSTRVASGLTQPVFAAAAPGNPSTLYVLQQNGAIRTFNTATNALSGTVLNVAGIAGSGFTNAGGEQGLLGLAFHPDANTDGTRYAYIQHTSTGGDTRVARLTMGTDGTLSAGSYTPILTVPHRQAANHNAGWIGFNPAATGAARTHLYVGTGDGGGANDPNGNAQNPNSLLGKMLRIGVGTDASTGYTIPVGNQATGAPEVFASGLRNPYRASFDRGTGHLFIGDVGQDNFEEINVLRADRTQFANFGWRLREGNIATPTPTSSPVGGPEPPNYVAPVHTYGRSLGQSVTGGLVYRGPDAQLNGTYIFGDFVSSRIFSGRYDGTSLVDVVDRTSQVESGTAGGVLNSPSAFIEDGNGNFFVLDYGGEIYLITPVPEPASVLAVAAVVAVGLRVWGSGRRRKARTDGVF